LKNEKGQGLIKEFAEMRQQEGVRDKSREGNNVQDVW